MFSNHSGQIFGVWCRQSLTNKDEVKNLSIVIKGDANPVTSRGIVQKTTLDFQGERVSVLLLRTAIATLLFFAL